MATAAAIIFKEGTLHQVVINMPMGVDLTNYEAKIQVRTDVGGDIVLEFSTEDGTLLKSSFQILLEITANKSIDKAGSYKWQLMLYTDTLDAIKYSIYPFNIISAITL